MRNLAALMLILLSISTACAEQSEKEKRLDIIQYGLESEVSELIKTLGDEADYSYNQDLLTLFKGTRSTAVREAILSFFSKQKKDDLRQYALDVLSDPFDLENSTVNAVFAYAEAIGLKEALPSIRKLLENANSEYRSQAISALGKYGEAEDAQYLLDYFDGEIPGEEKERLIIRQNVMAALGSLKAVETNARLTEIAADDEENANIRATAAVAIGEMGKPESLPVLLKLFGNSDPVLRASAISGLSHYADKDALDTITEGFKDSYYKVRLESIKAAERLKLDNTVPSLFYRAETDPQKTVQLAAYEALGSINSSKTNEWLKAVVLNEKKSEEMRVKALSVLAKNNFGYISPDLPKLIEPLLKDDKKKWMRYEMGKILANTESQSTDTIALSYLTSKDIQTKSIGLDMFAKNRYGSMKASVEAIAADEKQGALQRRAKKILGIDQ
jgi:HEAT repeat protein